MCAEILIPSVFPFMVLTNLLISCNFDRIIGHIIKRPFEAVFHLNSNLASAYFLGLIAGFPQGAYAICNIYNKGGCTKDEAEQALCFCNNTGPAFAIAAIGTMYNDIRTGITVYILQICISILYGIITRPRSISQSSYTPIEKKTDLSVIPHAITSSVIPMLNICAYVVIFSLISALITILPLPVYIKGFVLSLCEISSATAYIARYSLPIAFTGFALLWSGICVHMQTYSAVMRDFSIKKYCIGKLIQGISVFLILYLKNIRF